MEGERRITIARNGEEGAQRRPKKETKKRDKCPFYLQKHSKDTMGEKRSEWLERREEK